MLLTERYQAQITGLLSCYDRIIIQGTLPGMCFADGMTSYLYANGIRIFDYPEWAQALRDELRSHAEATAANHGLKIEFIRKIDDFRKDDRIQALVRERGEHPGLVHIFSAIETCTSYQPWHDKQTGKTFLKPDSGKCLPFRLQFYMNGHNWLASRLAKQGITYRMRDNAFLEISDWEKAQQLSDRFPG